MPVGSWPQAEPGSAREAREALGEALDTPGTPQEQLRNERREFQENLVFQAWEASGGPRGTQNRWGGLAGAKEKSQIPGHPSGGRVLRFLVRAQGWDFQTESESG